MGINKVWVYEVDEKGQFKRWANLAFFIDGYA